MAVIKIPENAIDNPINEGFNSVIVAMPTPMNITSIGGSKANSVLIPYSKNCNKAIVGATKI